MSLPAEDAHHLYGVVRAEDLHRLTGLPPDASYVRYGKLAALIRPVPRDLGRQLRRYLLGYAEILDRLAAAGPVLPIRFGVALPHRSAVASRVLAPNYGAYGRALAGLAGKRQFRLRARYRGDVAIRGALAAALDEAARRAPGRDTQRRNLGRLVAPVVDAKRAVDRELLVAELADSALTLLTPVAYGVESDRIADVTCLVAQEQQPRFEAVVAELTDRWRRWAQLRLSGPVAPFDFAAAFVRGRAEPMAELAPQPLSGRAGGAGRAHRPHTRATPGRPGTPAPS